MRVSVLIFPVGEDRYAIPASAVREVVADPRPTRLPTVPALMVGVFNLRGEVVPVFDLAALLGIGALDDGPFAVVLTTPAGPAGIVVGALPKVASLDEPIASSELRAALGVYAVGDDIVVLLDIEVLLLAHNNATALLEASAA